jgi:hypothetical protein
MYNVIYQVVYHRELVSTNMLKYGIYMYGHVTYAIYNISCLKNNCVCQEWNNCTSCKIYILNWTQK